MEENKMNENENEKEEVATEEVKTQENAKEEVKTEKKKENEEKKNGVLWTDKKRTIFGLPISFTRYTLTSEKLIIDTGFIARKQEEVRLYRIVDFTVKQRFFQRIFRVGDIQISSSDNSQENFTVYSVKKAYKVKDLISDMVEKERENKNIFSGEILK